MTAEEALRTIAEEVCGDEFYVDVPGDHERQLRADISPGDVVRAFHENQEALRNEVIDRDERIREATETAVRFGGDDAAHHKAWVIDQMVRHLAGDNYAQIVAEACEGEDGPETYEWDEGIAP